MPTRLLRLSLRHPRLMPAALLVAAAMVVGMLASDVSGAAAGSLPARQTTADAGGAANGPVIRTDRGPVRGLVKNGVSEFLGIPYAAPPTGPLRWQPPQLHDTWTKPLDATSYGPTCPQITTLGVFATPSVSEDCLYLNVFTPNPRHARGQGLPVFVWIHGGGNVDGESNDYDGSKLATGGRYGGSNTVVVTINYRLGLLGFLANTALDSEGHLFGNYGIMDQQAALRWVQRNIAAFGGDPNRVALGGQSAGAHDTDLNVVSPLAAGLFNRGISESGFTGEDPSLASAMSKGDAFAKAAGCTGTNAAVASCLRSLSVAQILQLQGTPNANGPYVNGPMVDGTVVPITATQAWTTGRYNHMPMMGGRVEDEGNFGIGITEYFSGPPMMPVTATAYTNYVTSTYSPPTYPAGTAAKVLAEYPLSNYATPQLAEDRVMTDAQQCQNLHSAGLIAQQVPTYDYTFNYRNAPYYFPAMPGFVPLAAHTIDIQFLFPLYHGGIFGVPHPLNAQETTLSNELVAAWTNFARTGNPNRADDSPWPQFNSAPGAPAVLNENVPTLSTLTVAQTSAMYHCDFWNTILTF